MKKIFYKKKHYVERLCVTMMLTSGVLYTIWHVVLEIFLKLKR